MFKSRSAILGLLIIGILVNLGGIVAEGGYASPAESGSPKMQVSLAAADQTTSWDVREPGQPRFDLPVLYLRQGRLATAQSERTLEISLSGLAGETEILIEALSQHEDVATGRRHSESTTAVIPDRSCTADAPCSFLWTMDAGAMPSDFYSLRVTDTTRRTLWENPNPNRPDFVALDTWEVGLGDYTARVYYATLFPFARGSNDLAHRLPTGEVPGFIENQFVPIIADTWRDQVEDWGFGPQMNPNWDADNTLEVIVTDPPFALFDGTGTYARLTDDDGRPYPQRRIWWYASNNSFQAYDSLESAYRAVYAHEFFHLLQWNVLLSTGRPESWWLSWVESQGRFAAAVQHPQMEIGREHVVGENSAYTSAANRFLTGHLNTSYNRLEADPGNKYDTALYWRFLYEQYGDMDVVRAALEEMALRSEPQVVQGMPQVMDRVFARVEGPFATFEESLVAFSRANYALRLANGRCALADATECQGLYFDPQGAYAKPPLEEETRYDGRAVEVEGAIPASYGMDFLEVALGRGAHDGALTISVQGEGAGARFDVQIWKLGPGYAGPRAITPQPETAAVDGSGAHRFVIPQVDTLAYNRVALIITRLDADEATDPVGGYHVTLAPAAGES